jgi:hypothetical protein
MRVSRPGPHAHAYVAGRDYDLTEATRDRLGLPGLGTVLANH